MSEASEIRIDELSTGRKWHLVMCAKPDNDLIEGKHFILEGLGQPTPDDLTRKELNELRLLAFDLADELASEPGRWRVDFNGSTVATQRHFHAHLKLPAGNDRLARLVGV